MFFTDYFDEFTVPGPIFNQNINKNVKIIKVSNNVEVSPEIHRFDHFFHPFLPIFKNYFLGADSDFG